MCKCHINIFLMPSQRKRIGFLPRPDIQKIINQICINNKLSQSKVTGILVEEALISRGFIDSNLNNKLLLITNNINNAINNENNKFDSKEVYKNEEIQMINDFIEFKFFKNIMNKNKKNYR